MKDGECVLVPGTKYHTRAVTVADLGTPGRKNNKRLVSHSGQTVDQGLILGDVRQGRTLKPLGTAWPRQSLITLYIYIILNNGMSRTVGLFTPLLGAELLINRSVRNSDKKCNGEDLYCYACAMHINGP